MSYATAAQFKAFSGVSDGNDTFIDTLIARAEKIINRYTHIVTFENSETTSFFTDEWCLKDWLYMPVHQCESITSIKLYELDADRDLVDTFTSSSYYLDKSKARLRNNYGNIRNSEIEVVYTPNNGGVPDDIVQATIEVALAMWQDSNLGEKMFNVQAREIAEERIEIYNASIPKTAKLILDGYKRFI